MSDMPEPEPRAFCPICEPEVDQAKEYVVDHRCFRHRQDLEGEGDRLMKKILGTEPDKAHVDPQTQRAWGAFLRRPR
jgi:hypothetical protein